MTDYEVFAQSGSNAIPPQFLPRLYIVGAASSFGPAIFVRWMALEQQASRRTIGITPTPTPSSKEA